MELRAKLRFGILVVLMVIAAVFLMGATGFSLLSGLRAYVGAECLWSKSQQQATYQLSRYVHSEDEIYYQAFRQSLTIPLGHKTARLEMDSPDFRFEVAEQGFLDGGNHPDDIWAMVKFYRLFKNIGHIQLAIEQWTIADQGIVGLSALGEEIHNAAMASDLDSTEQINFLARIDELQVALSQAEDQFSHHITLASRQASRGLIIIMVVFSILGGIICFLVMRGIQTLLYDLSRSEGRFRRLAENAPDVIYRMMLPSGQYEYMSPIAKSVLGYSADEFYAQPQLIADIIHPDWKDYFAKEWVNLVAGKMPAFYEYQIVHPTLGVRWLNQRNVMVRDNDNQPVAIEGVVTDITERKNLEEKQERMASELWHAHKMEAVGTLAGGIAHDFNNVLYAIMGNAELARADVQDGTAPAQCLDEVLVASTRARDLVRRILAFSRRETQNLTAVNVPDIVDEAIKLMRATIPATVEITMDLPALGCVTLADATQVHQVVMNLCTNASQALEPNGGRISIKVDEVDIPGNDVKNLPAGLTGDFIRLEIQDTGPGIDPETRGKIFDPYFTTKPIGQGTGMGLAVVHGIVINYGGAITVENAPQGGSIFRVYLPRTDASLESPIQDDPPIAIGAERILLVDDEPSLVRLNEKQLSRQGYQVASTTSSQMALEMFRSDPHSFDLVVTDQTMPDMTGDELAKALLEIRPNLPIILCTGYSSKISEENAHQVGIRAFLMKPFRHNELAIKIRETLGE